MPPKAVIISYATPVNASANALVGALTAPQNKKCTKAKNISYNNLKLISRIPCGRTPLATNNSG